MLFDLTRDPRQRQPLNDAALEARMIELLVREMQANGAPLEQYDRLGVGTPDPL